MFENYFEYPVHMESGDIGTALQKGERNEEVQSRSAG